VTAGQLRQEDGNPGRAQYAASKVPQITVFFWIIKVLTTAQGEAVADFLYLRYGAVIAGTLGAAGLVIALILQFRARRYVAWIYWLAVVMVAIFGTMAADGLHIKLGIPYSVTTPFFAAALAVIFVVWYKTEKTLSIHSIYTWRREAFYWATVMATFALGTALGDLTATTVHLGYLKSGILFAVLIAVPAVAHWRLGMNAIVAFWFAYIVTRPLGASFADWMGVSHAYGGLGLGRGPVGLSLTIVIVCFVGYLTVTRKDVDDDAAAQSRGRARHRQQRA
jgi:uncharacterized membrane-anchored protein